MSTSCGSSSGSAAALVRWDYTGHAGDGNLHPNILFDKRDPAQWARVGQMVNEEFATALELGGTLSGEHGVGTLKLPYLEQALGPLSIEIQKRIKQALDPLNILNPGKVFPGSPSGHAEK